MVVHNAKTIRTAKIQAADARKKGFNANVFKRKGGNVKVSVTRK